MKRPSECHRWWRVPVPGGFGADGGDNSGHQVAGWGEERWAGQSPVQFVLEHLAGFDFLVEQSSFDDQPGTFLKLSTVTAGEKRKLNSISRSPGMTLSAPVPERRLEIWNEVGGKYSCP